MLKHRVVCGGKPDVCQVWFENWTRQAADNPECIDKIQKALQHNQNLPTNNYSIDMFPTDKDKVMVQLWKAHGHALADAFHTVLDTRPFTLTHGDLRSDNIFRKVKGNGPAFKFIDWQTYAAASPGCDMTQLLDGSIAPLEGMDHLDEILDEYIRTLHAANSATRAYTRDMLKEDFAMSTTMLFIGVCVPFGPLLESLPDGHPLWVLFDQVWPRFLKCTAYLDCAELTIRTAKQLGLEVDPNLPAYVEPPRKVKLMFKKAANAVIASNRISSLLGAAMLADSALN